MHRIDGSGNVGGKFSEGNAQAGQLATKVTADWLNDLQENIVHIIEQAGIPLVKGQIDQLYLALVQIAAGAGGGGGGGGGVPTTRLILTSGLLTGGGTLANDLVIGLAKASGAQVAAGTDDTTAITPAGLVAAMGSVKSSIGYTKLFNGFILMWGQANILSNATTVISLPTTFPTMCVYAGIEGGRQVNDAEDNSPFVSGKGTNSISVFSASDVLVQGNWFAIGF
jgi:hypothetical protein